MYRTTVITLLLLLAYLSWGHAQNPEGKEKYWIFFQDKPHLNTIPIEKVLSPKAIERRRSQNIPIHQTDYPVSKAYLQTLREIGIDLRHSSKWFNGVSSWMSKDQIPQVATLPFVRSIQPIHPAIRDYEPIVPTKASYNPGYSATQIEMLGLDQLHRNGFNGQGITIAVMDNGFNSLDFNPLMDHLFQHNRILATWDFVNNEANVYDQGSHGSWVLSILAGWQQETDDNPSFYGSAHGATYILCHTENDYSETTQEEDNWIAAMEFADSAGADIFSTSLGYRGMDNPAESYTYNDMDGNTTIITRGADLAASKGIIVLNSAGNSGNNKIAAPADGDSVIAVGAVDENQIIAAFSSLGPTSDGRLKPDICAMGQGTAFATLDGYLTNGNGTSFSCPMASGMVACLLQAAPTTPTMEIYDAVIRSADRYNNPDTIYGYGIPNAPEAYRILTGNELPPILHDSILGTDAAVVYPNPTTYQIHLHLENEGTAFPARIQLVDAAGRLLMDWETQVSAFYNRFQFNRTDHFSNAPSGRYTLIIRNTEEKSIFLSQKIILTD